VTTELERAYQVHTEARGPHWIAWISRTAEGRPEGSIVFVARTREEAEARAHSWAAKTAD
jgi:hypothetical protein